MKGKGFKGLHVAPDAQEPAADEIALPDDGPAFAAASPAPAPTAEPVLPDEPTGLQKTYDSVSSANPDQAASVIGLANKTTLPESYVAQNLPAIQKVQAAPPTSLFTQLEAQYPGTTKFLTDPRNMAVTHDDLPNVAAHEGLVSKLASAWKTISGADQEPAHERSLSELADRFKENYQADQDRLEKTDKDNRDAFINGIQMSTLGLYARQKMPDKAAPDAGDIEPWLLNQIGTLAGDFPAMTIGSMIGALAGGAAGGTAGGAAASVVPGVGTIAGVGLGALGGAAAGGSAGAFALPAGLRQALIDHIQKGDAKDFPELLERVKDAMAEAAKSGAIGLATAAAGLPAGILAKGVANPLAHAAIPVAAEIGAMTVASSAEQGHWQTWDEVMSNALLVAGMHGATHTAGLALGHPEIKNVAMQEQYEKARSDQALGFYTALGVAAEKSKLRGRLPEAHAGLVEDLVKGSPAETIYLPADAATEYFQSKHLNPDEVMGELGATASYAEAKETGGDVQIPFSKWAEKFAGTEHWQGLSRDVKFTPDDLTARQIDARSEETKGRIKEAADLAATAEQNGNKEEIAQHIDAGAKIYNDIHDQLRAAGLTSAEQKYNPEIYQKFFTTLGQKLGIDPAELYKKFPLTIEHRVFQPKEAAVTDLSQTHADFKPEVLKTMRDEIAGSESSKGGVTTDEQGNVTGKFGATSTAPEYFKESGYKKSEVVKALDAHIEGKELTARQSEIVKELYTASGHDKAYFDPATMDWLDQEGRPIEKTAANANELFQAARKKKVIDERLKRAKELGFNTDKVFYHGTKADIEAFDPNALGASTNAGSARQGFFFASDASTASDYADLSPSRRGLRKAAEEKALMDRFEKFTDSMVAKYGKTEMNFGKGPVTSWKDKATRAELKKYSSLVEEFKKSAAEREALPDAGQNLKYKQHEASLALEDAQNLAHQKSRLEATIERRKEDVSNGDKDAQSLVDQYSKQLKNIENRRAAAEELYKKLDAEAKGMEAEAKSGANVIPVHLKMENPYVHDFKGSSYRDQTYADIMKEAKDSGHDSVIFKNTYDPADPNNKVKQDIVAVFEPNQIRSVNAEFKNGDSTNILHQPGAGDEPRGRIRFGEKQQFSIDMFERADKSTFLHESGHYFLEVMGTLASEEGAPAAIKDDYAKLLKWFGVDSKEGVKTEHHEMFARGFEAYLREGKAPTPELQSAFSNFKDWLVNLYREFKALHVNLTDDVRGVMDRMLASQDEIDAAKKKVGISDDEIPGATAEGKAKIRTMQERARDIAENTLLKEQMKELDSKHKEFLAAETERQTEKAKADVLEEPIFKAGAELEGDPVFVKYKDAAAVADKFLGEKLDSSEAGKFEALAEVHGFESGEDLAQELIMAKETKAYETEVSKRVSDAMAPHADMRNTDKIKAEAMKAIHSEHMTELLALEKEVLTDLMHQRDVSQEVTKRRRVEARVDAEQARAHAKELLSAKPIKDAGNARIYVTAERNAAVKVAKAMAKGDYEAAADAKRQQMLNHALASEAMKNSVAIEKSLEYLGKFSKRGQDLLGAPYSAIKQIDNLLARFGLAEARPEDQATMIGIAKNMAENGEAGPDIANATGMVRNEGGQWVPEALPDYLTRINDGYFGLSIPDSLLHSEAKTYKNLTMQDVADLKATVKSIFEIGKKYNQFLGLFDKADISEAALAFRESVENEVGSPYADSFKIGEKNYNSKFEKVLDGLKDIPGAFDRVLANMLTIAEKLDGGHDGPAHEYIYRPLKQAEDRKITRMKDVMKKVDDIFAAHYTEKEFAAFKENGTYFPEIGRKLTKQEVLAMAMNWGNEGNRDRIRLGYDLTDGQVQKILETLDKKDWDFVQATWNHLDTYWPEIAALEMKVRGVEPKKVQNAEVHTQYGVYDGGYYPIAYDFEKSGDAFQNTDQKNALYKQFGAAKAQTDSGHTQSRVSHVVRPVRLNLDVMHNHLENIIHDLEYRPAVIDLNRFLAKRDVKGAIEGAMGVKGYTVINDWLKSAATEPGESLNPFEKGVRWFRFATTFYNLAYKFSTIPKIGIENVVNLSSELGVSGAARALKNFYSDPVTMKNMVEEKSIRMKQRATLRDRDLADIAKKWNGKRQGAFMAYAFWTHAALDEAVSMPLWADVYKRGMSEHGNEQKAIDMADESVTRSFMSGTALDQAAALRGSENTKFLTMAFSYSSMMYNRFSTQASKASLEWTEGNKMVGTAIAARAMVYTFLMPALTASLTREFLRNTQSENEDEKTKRLIGSVIEEGTPLKFVPLVRDLVPFVVKKAQGEHTGSLQVTAMEGAMETLLTPIGEGLHAAFASDGHLSEKFPEEVAKAASLLIGVPASVNAVALNFMDWMHNNGKATWRDAITRRTKK